MPNTYFRFKQFTVHQEKCAMKVCTDACLFGAWLASKNISYNRALDIGAGTGLLSLMMSQKNDGLIDAVEIDPSAAQQAADNFSASPWSKQLSLINIPVQQFEPHYSYDLVFSNPPFFNNDLKSPDAKRNLALHGNTLNLEDLIASGARLLAKDKLMAILMPAHRGQELEQLMQARGFTLLEKTEVRQTPLHPFFRVMYLYRNNATPVPLPRYNEITIKNAHQQYTAACVELLQDYYL